MSNQGSLEGHQHLGGENISTIEVEDFLYRHTAVARSRGRREARPELGQTPCAFVTPEDGAVARPRYHRFCRERMSRFKAPRHVIFGPLPKTSTGKIKKFVLRESAKEAG